MSTGVVFGIPEVTKILEQITPAHSQRLITNTLRGVAAEIRNKAKANVVRDTGNLKKSMFVYKPRTHPTAPQFQVKFRKDAYYWRFVEYGTGGGRGSHLPFLKGERETPLYPGARPFLQPAVHETRADMENIVKREFSKKLEQAIKRELKKARASRK